MGIGQTTQTVQKLEEKITKAVSIREKIDLMNSLAWQLRICDPEKAHFVSQETLELSKSSGVDGQYKPGIAASLVTQSFLDGEAGNLGMSLSYALEALSYVNEKPHSKILVNAWYVLGWSHYYSGDYPASLEFGLKSLKMAREAGLTEMEAWCLDLVASTYKDPARTLQMYQEAYDIFEKMGSIEGQSRILNNWAYTLMEAKQYAPALEMAQRSLQLAKDGGLKKDQINISATIGETLAAMGDYEQALSSLHDAILLFDKYGRDISLVYIFIVLGQVYLKQNDLEHAEQALFKALESSKQMEMRNEQARCHQYLSEIFERRGGFDQALEHYKKFQELRESTAGEEALRQLAALRVSHQIETAERDAEIHRLQKEKLQIELDEHKRIHAILEDLATRDPLTNLFNRRHFLNLAEQEWKRSLRYGHPLCALMLDMDHFKQINDQHGHAAGDKALNSVANVIRSTLRSSEIAGRYGGDEFVILLPETQPKNGVRVAERISQAIKEYAISSKQGVIELSPSIGVACMSGKHDDPTKSLNELLSHADKALYNAKRVGKGQVCLYPEQG
ncbi:MAG TPA: diguanylate cyclase [Anaerolineales bacterium]|nr:diguanylate cyclase [Anaerolineales bacterium]